MGLIDSILGAGGDFLSYTPWSWIDSAVESGLDSLGLSQHGRDQYFQRDLQRETLEKQQAFQREMFGLSTDFAREQTSNQQWFTKMMYQQQLQDMLKNYPELMRMQSDAQFNLWRQQFKMQNDYNSPGAQTARLLGAGINPSSVFGGSGSVATSQMSPSSVGGQPPMISPTPFNSHMFGSAGSPVGLPSGYVGNIKDRLTSLGSFFRDVSEMQLNQKKIGRYDEQMDAQIKESLAKAGLDESKSAYQKLITAVDGFFLPHKKASEVKLNLALAAKYAAEENEAESQSKLNEALEELNKTKNEEAKARLPFVEMEMRAEIDDIKASAAEKRAQAAKANQEAQTEKYQTQLKKIESETNYRLKKQNISTLLNELRARQEISAKDFKEAKLKLERASDELYLRNSLEFNRWLDNSLEIMKNKVPTLATVKVE